MLLIGEIWCDVRYECTSETALLNSVQRSSIGESERNVLIKRSFFWTRCVVGGDSEEGQWRKWWRGEEPKTLKARKVSKRMRREEDDSRRQSGKYIDLKWRKVERMDEKAGEQRKEGWNGRGGGRDPDRCEISPQVAEWLFDKGYTQAYTVPRHRRKPLTTTNTQSSLYFKPSICPTVTFF